jgi:hypothetical protein
MTHCVAARLGIVSLASSSVAAPTRRSLGTARRATGFESPALCDGTIYAAVPFQDGCVLAGELSRTGGIEARNVAFWNLAEWRSLGAGLDPHRIGVQALAVFDGELFAGRSFHESGCPRTWPIVCI